MEMNRSQLPAVQYPTAVLSPHPLSASFGRQTVYAEFIPGESLDEYLVRTDLMPVKPENFILTINAIEVPMSKMDTVFPRRGDMIILRARVRNGGEGGSDPLRVVLMIAVMVAAYYTGGLSTILYSSHAVGFAVRAAVMIGGMMLVNKLVPIKVPQFDDSQPSPTYALTGSRNRARPYEPMPLVFGTIRVYPDHGAKPYSSYNERDQILNQVFNFGLTDVAISGFKIGDAVLDGFYGVREPEVSVGNTGVLYGFSTNVDTLPGGDLVANAGTYITRTSSDNTTTLAVSISGLSFFVGQEEGLTNARITLLAEFRVSGSADPWAPFFSENVLGFVWASSNTIDIINGDKEVIRRDYLHPVPEGKYDVRVQLVDAADVVYDVRTCDEEGNDCTVEKVYSPRGLNNGGMTQALSFDQLKSYQKDTSDYTNQHRVGLAITANGQLNGIVDQFNAMVSVTIPTWNGSAWVDAVSSNPAWIFIAIARGKHDAVSGARLYGAGLPDSRIDIETLKLWGQFCIDRDLECNIVFDAKMTVVDMLNTVARCGRATATWSNGSLGVVYDEGNKSPVGMFGMSNIVRDSFQVSYISEQLVDEVVLEFVNPAIGWKRDTVRTVVPGVVSPVNSVQIYIPGITDEAQAGKEANLIAAEQFYRRRTITWESDMEGLTVQRGDVAILSHDLTQWDYSGRLVSGTTTTLELDRSVPFTPATQHYIGVRFPDGSYETVDVNFAGVENEINEPEAFDDAYWTKVDSSILPNNTNAPDGTMTADKLVADTSALAHHFHNSPGETVGVGTSTFSVYAKAAEHPGLRLLLWNSTDSVRGSTDFDLLTGVVVSGTGSISNEGNGYYRCSISGVNTTGIEIPHVYVLNSSFITTFTGNDFDGIHLWGAMLNPGILADYINDANVITLGTPLSSSPNLDVDNIPMDYMWFFGPKATPGKLVKITDIKPLNEDRVAITATDEDDNFYLAERDTYTYVTPGSFITGIPIISNLGLGESLVIVGSGFGSKVNVSWTIDGEYGGAFIRAGDEDTPMRDVGRTLDRSFTFEWTTGKTVQVEVVAHNLNYESSDVSKATASLLLVGKMKLPADVANFSALQNGAAVVLRWTPAPDIDLAGTEIRYGVRGSSTWENATPLTEVTKGTNITSQALPDGDWTMYAKHRDTSLNYSLNAASSNVLFESDQDIIIQEEQSPDWVENIDFTRLADEQPVLSSTIFENGITIDGNASYSMTVDIVKDSVPKETRFSHINFSMLGGVNEVFRVLFDTSNGDVDFNTFGASGSYTVQDLGTHFILTITRNASVSANTTIDVDIYPAAGVYSGGLWTLGVAAQGFIDCRNVRLIKAATSTNLIAHPNDLSLWANIGITFSDGLGTNFVTHHTGKLVPKSQDADSDDGALLWVDDTVFENFVVNPYEICTYVSTEIDIGFDDTVRLWGDIQSALGPGETGVANPLLEVDHRLASGTYDGFQPWTIGNAEMRYARFAAVLDTSIGNAYLSGFNPTVDLLERTDNQLVTVLAGGTTVTFDRPFHLPPWGIASPVSGAGSIVSATITLITATQGFVNIWNSAGTSVAGTASITLTGV